MTERTQNRSELVTAANGMTLLRLLATPVIMYLFIVDQPWPAAILFVLAALTDFLDGWLARSQGTTSEFGKMFDPLVDRVFIGGVAIAVLFTPWAPPTWAVVIVVGRDLLLLGGFAVLKRMGASPPQVTMTGKVATALLMSGLPGLVIWPTVGLILLAAGIILSLLAGYEYVRKGIISLK